LRVLEFTIRICVLAEYRAMKMTVDLPDELLHQANTEAARRGLRLADLLVDALRRVLPPAQRLNSGQAPTQPGAVGADLSALMADGEGIIDSGVDDLATHPRHMERPQRDCARIRCAPSAPPSG
jgi:hypothetical protein